MFNSKSNVIFINPSFYTETNEVISSFISETSEFTAKSNGAELVAETFFTVTEPKKGKKSAVVKMITPKEDVGNTLEYLHTNKYIEKYRSINTTFNTADPNTESDGRKYIVIAIPFNGNINAISVEGNSAEVVYANYTSTVAIKFEENDRLLYGKICYLVIKVTPDTAGWAPTLVNFTTVSSKWNDNTCTQTIRSITATIPVSFLTNQNDEDKYVVPMVNSTNVEDAELNAEGKLVNPPVKFNSLFKIAIDKTVKNRTNTEHHKRSSYFTKKNDDIVTNFFNNDAVKADSKMSKKFKEAKKRYSEYDDE